MVCFQNIYGKCNKVYSHDVPVVWAHGFNEHCSMSKKTIKCSSGKLYAGSCKDRVTIIGGWGERDNEFVTYSRLVIKARSS